MRCDETGGTVRSARARVRSAHTRGRIREDVRVRCESLGRAEEEAYIYRAGPEHEQLPNAGIFRRSFLPSCMLMHPNVLRIEGISSPASLNHFIAYENAHWKTAEAPLAAVLKDDLTRSVILGFKMVAGLSSGMNHLSVQAISLASLGMENFDVFLDLNDRFLISVNPPTLPMGTVTDDLIQEDNTTISWEVFNALCQKAFCNIRSGLEFEFGIIIVATHHRRQASRPAAAGIRLANDRSRTAILGHHRPPNLLYSVNKFVWNDGRSAPRCAGYIREEVTLASTTGDSAVVSPDAPSPLEICSVCHEVVGLHEIFRCPAENAQQFRIFEENTYRDSKVKFNDLPVGTVSDSAEGENATMNQGETLECQLTASLLPTLLAVASPAERIKMGLLQLSVQLRRQKCRRGTRRYCGGRQTPLATQGSNAVNLG
ncbi:hypothetical protein DFH09DRAFT_1304476 [Mycena vulgaris]|nr:hypothetical protein DFH09DRAFT_1304476 [Mycena vulgaris]